MRFSRTRLLDPGLLARPRVSPESSREQRRRASYLELLGVGLLMAAFLAVALL